MCLVEHIYSLMLLYYDPWVIVLFFLICIDKNCFLLFVICFFNEITCFCIVMLCFNALLSAS